MQIQNRLVLPELRAADSELGKALEYSLRSKTWTTFVLTHHEDQRALVYNGDRSLSYVLIEGDAHNASPDVQRPFLSEETLRELGVRGYLDQLLVCDPLAIEAARRLNDIDHILVGTVETDRLYDINPSRVTELLTPAVSNFVDEKELTSITHSMKLVFIRSRYPPHNIQMTSSRLDPERLLNLPLKA